MSAHVARWSAAEDGPDGNRETNEP